MKIAGSVTELIGNTPMVQLKRIVPADCADVIIKLENYNPGGSIKTRIAFMMIQEAEKSGQLLPGGTIVEPTSGNTGVGLALVGGVLGYPVILTMPETMSLERRKLLAAYGAQLVLTPGEEGMPGAIAKAKEIVEDNPDYFTPQQFENPVNPEMHRQTTAQEILRDTEGQLAAFVSAVGTGGTVTGVGEVLKAAIPEIKIVAVEPFNSPVLSGGKPGPHKIQGIGAGFIPQNVKLEIIDQVIKVTYDDALQTTRRLAKEEGLLLGISSGAAVWAALTVAKEFAAEKRVVVIAPDTGERYLSTELFSLDNH